MSRSHNTSQNIVYSMSRSHNTLQNIVYSMIEFNREIQYTHTKNADLYLSNVCYARSCQTVAFNPGRQVGKTTLIASCIGENDIAISSNTCSMEELKRKMSFFNAGLQQAINVHTLNPADFKGFAKETFDIVWVDNASVMSEDDIQKIYLAFAGICKQFVFIG